MPVFVCCTGMWYRVTGEHVEIGIGLSSRRTCRSVLSIVCRSLRVKHTFLLYLFCVGLFLSLFVMPYRVPYVESWQQLWTWGHSVRMSRSTLERKGKEGWLAGPGKFAIQTNHKQMFSACTGRGYVDVKRLQISASARACQACVEMAGNKHVSQKLTNYFYGICRWLSSYLIKARGIGLRDNPCSKKRISKRCTSALRNTFFPVFDSAWLLASIWLNYTVGNYRLCSQDTATSMLIWRHPRI